MERKVAFNKISIDSPYKPVSDVKKVIFHIDDLDRSYYLKWNSISRSHELGNIAYEMRGYELLKHFGIQIPDYFLGTVGGKQVLATSPVHGTPVVDVKDVQGFSSCLDSILTQHLDMWQRSALETPIMFQGLRKIVPAYESLMTALRMRTITERDNSLTRDFVMCFNEVLQNLICKYAIFARSNQFFFQHGDELLNHFIVNPDGAITVIDPSPILTVGMERALNKILGASLLFNLEINSDGIPVDSKKVAILIRIIRKYEQMIRDVNSDFGLPKITCLREISFINLARVYFEIYNQENSVFFHSMDTHKFLKLSTNIYEELRDW